MKKIIISGLPRSGSTWQYNIVRIALIHAGYSVYGSWVGDYDFLNKSEYHIIKTHSLNKNIQEAWKIFTSVREFKGVKESLQRIGWYESDKKIISSYHKWTECCIVADYIMSYSDMILNKLSITKNIINILGLSVCPVKVLNEVKGLNLPQVYYDKITLLHHNHFVK